MTLAAAVGTRSVLAVNKTLQQMGAALHENRRIHIETGWRTRMEN